MNLVATRLFKSPVLLASLLGLSLATGCHKKQGPDPNSIGPATAPPVAAPTASITADPLSIDLGQSVVLNWRSQNANVVTIDGIGQVNVNGTQTVSPSSSTNFRLTAKGDGGTVEANVRVTVNVPVAPTPPPADASNTGDMGSDAAFPPERAGCLLRLRQLRSPSRRDQRCVSSRLLPYGSPGN